MPFDSPAAAHVMALQLFAVPRSLATCRLAHPLPDGLSELVARTLAKRPEDRPTLDALAHGLRRCLDDPNGPSPETAQADAPARVGALSRAERALSAGPTPTTAAPTTRPERRPFLWLWALPAERENALQAALALRGVDASGWYGDTPPPDAIEGVHAGACVLAHGPEVSAKLAALATRERPLPAMVIDVASAEATAAMIRAGAADVCACGLDDAALGQKIGRLLRRRR